MAIITLQDFKTFAYIDTEDTSEDAKLNMLIAAVNRSINNYVGRNLEASDYNGDVLAVEVAVPGAGYTVNDVLLVADGKGLQLTVLEVDGSGGVTTVDILTTGPDYDDTTSHATSGGSGMGCKISIADYRGEVYDGSGTDALILRNLPLVSVKKVLLYGTELPQDLGWGLTKTTLLPGWFVKDYDNAILFNFSCWPNGRAIIHIRYTAGYTEIPSDIFVGALEMTDFYRRISLKPGVASEWLGSYNVSLNNSIGAMNGDLTIPDIIFKMALDNERAKTAKELL